MKKTLALTLYFLLCFSSILDAAVARNTGVANAYAGVSQVTISYNCTCSDHALMIVAVSVYDATSISGITYNGISLTPVLSTSVVHLYVYQLVAPTDGTHDVVVDFATVLGNAAIIGISSFTGANQSSPIGSSNYFDTSTGGDISVQTDVTGVANGMVVDFMASANTGASLTPIATYYFDYDYGSFNLASSTSTATGTVSMFWSWTGGAYVSQIAVVINPFISTPATARRRAVIIQ